MVEREFLTYAISEKYAQSEVAPQQRLPELRREITLLNRMLEELSKSSMVCSGLA